MQEQGGRQGTSRIDCKITTLRHDGQYKCFKSKYQPRGRQERGHTTWHGWAVARERDEGRCKQIAWMEMLATTNSKLELGSPLAQNGHLNRLASFCFPLAGACFFALLPIFQPGSTPIVASSTYNKFGKCAMLLPPSPPAGLL